MKRILTNACALITSALLGAVFIPSPSKPAQAHQVRLTRFDIQTAMTQALQRHQTQNAGPTGAELEQAIISALMRCRFQGQMLEGNKAEDDATDFQGVIRC
ncbi:MAG: hypothetical protein AAF221_14585 [Pseudomonadota bacterium]